MELKIKFSKRDRSRPHTIIKCLCYFWRKAERRCENEVQRMRKGWFIYLRSWTPRHQHRQSRLFERSEGPGRTSLP
jgi:hypothetical protein